jgi:hypothetical protein
MDKPSTRIIPDAAMSQIKRGLLDNIRVNPRNAEVDCLTG